MPLPAIDGGAQVMHFTTKGLINNNVKVKVLAINPTRNYIDLNSLPNDYKNITDFESVTVDTGIKLIGSLTNLFKTESYFIERFISKEFEQKIIKILETDAFDIIQLEHLYLCKYIPLIRAFSKAKIVLRPQNVEYVIWERYLKNINNPIKKLYLSIATNRLKNFEQSVNEQLDGIIALTKEDADVFKSFSNKKPIIVVPMGYDYEKLIGYNFEKQFEVTPIIYHLGSMDWLPNVEAVNWFFEKVLPIIEKKQINVNMSISGRNMPSWAYRYKSDNISILGEITNPLEYQEEKQIMIVPLWSGSGIRAKIIEGLALGKVIISTSIGAQGINYENDKNIIIADTPNDFAEQIIKCIQSPILCKEIGQNARKLSLSDYHYENTTKKMIGFYNQLLN